VLQYNRHINSKPSQPHRE